VPKHDADARRYEYRLTKKGIDLAPAMVEIVLWSARHEQTNAPPQVVRKMRNERAKFLLEIQEGWQAGQP
jgi:DNA-binding HxlR family transcriptional regulator